MDIGKDMAEKITHRIRISHHIKKHHRAYVLGGFSIFAIVQTISLLSGIFSKASHDFMISDNPIIQSINEFEETSSFLGLENNLQDEISGISSIANIFSDFFDGNINNDLEEEESENTEKEIVSLDINNIQTFVLDDPWDEDFDKLSGDILDFSRDSDLVQDSKVLKNISIEKSQKNNNTISVQIPKDTFVKEIVSSSSLGKPRELNYKGEILAPQELSQDWLKLNRIKADYAFEVGNSNDKIIFKDEYGSESFVKISVELDPDKFSANEKVWIKSSNDQVSRDNLGTYPVQQKIEDKKEILFVEFVVNHMTTFLIGKDDFNFFLGEDSSCKKSLTEYSPGQKVYACVEGENMRLLNWMRFSFDERNLERESWFGFQNGYEIILPRDFGNSLVLYLNYSEDKTNYELIAHSIYQKGLVLDLNLILGDRDCNPLREIDSRSLDQVYLCLDGKDLSQIKEMKFAESLADLDKEIRQRFRNGQQISLSPKAEGEVTIYAYFGPNEFQYMFLTSSVIVKALDNEWGYMVPTGVRVSQSTDFSNKYREITSQDGRSKLAINTLGKEVNLFVGNRDWDGLVMSPVSITDTRKAKKGDPGLAPNFIPQETFLVGSEQSSLTLDNDQQFDISLFVSSASPGDVLDMYYSEDGTNWISSPSQCIVGQDRVCSFKSSHMTLFVVGSMVWENFDFVNQRFWDQGPSSTNIINAFFGLSVGSRTAYSRHWKKSTNALSMDFPCRPSNTTGVVYLNPGTRNAFTVPANTIYVLRSGHYIQNGAITMSTCSALVGSGNVTISKNGSFNLINASSVNQVILDNLSLNGSGNGNNIINFNTVSYFTINDVQAYGGTSNGIYVSGGADGLLNNIQSFNNNKYGLHIITAQYSIVNNSQIFNNGSFGFYSQNTQYSSVNNSQIFNNGSVGMYAATATGWMISNTQVYKNSVRGIYVVNTPNFMMNNVRSFHNATYDLQLTSTASSGLYYGKNLIPNRVATHFYNGSVNSTLGWSAGALSTSLPDYDCDLLSRPLLDNNASYPFYLVGDCNYVGRRAAWTVGRDGIVKYTYGDNFLSGNHVLKQVVPVNWYVGGNIFNPVILNQISSISYHGHRFVGEYDDPSARDTNTPKVLFDSNNPPNGTNVISGTYSNNLTIKTHIHEPNLYYFPWAEVFSPFYQNNVYEVYDDTLALMLNFDRVAEIGETTSLVRDLSKRKNKGTINGGLTWTSNGKRNGAYQFNGIDSYITIPTLSYEYLKKLDDFTVSFWIKATVPSNTVPIIDARAVTQGFGINLTNNGRIQHYINGAGYTPSSNYVADNNRHNVIITRQTNTVIVYIDGIKKSTWNNGVSTQLSLSDQITIGYDPDNIAGNVYFSGLLDEFRLYKRALTTNEIAHFYNSNLSAKANNWEYVVNYTGVQNWQMGNYTYNLFKDSYNGIKDSDNNEVGGLNGNVVKNYGCNGNFSISWGIDRYLSGNFWSQNPNNCDIIYALYGTGGDKTNYGNYCATPGCHWSDMTVQYLSPGTNQIPQFLNSKTIYVLSPGNYIQTYSVNMGNDCTALVGGSGTVTWYNNTSQYEQLYMLGRDIVVDNIVFHGSGNGVGGFVSPHEQAILHNSTRCSTVNNVNIFGHGRFGIFSEGSEFKVSNSSIYNIWGDGALLRLNSTSFIENTKIYNGRRDGINIVGSKNKIYSGTEIFNIYGDGIQIDGVNQVFVDDVQIYNNHNAGIQIQGASHYHVFNNVKIFDNNIGIATSNDIDPKEYSTLNNSQIFNNSSHGLSIYRTKNFTINNTHVYNNGGNGIYFAGRNNSGILNDVFSYNNGGYGIRSEWGNHTRYGLLTTFENQGGFMGIQNGTLSAGNSSTYAYLGRTGGTTNTTPCMNCSWVSNPRTSIGSQYMIDTTLYPKCDVRGNIATWTGTVDTSYRYGVSLTGQQKPVFWYDNLGVPTFTGMFVQYPNPANDRFYAIDHDINKYVAQDSDKISPDYSTTQCTCTDITNYPWVNDNFLNGQFWGTLPTYKPYCHIIAALYGSGTNGSDRTAYTQFWNNWTGACNVENIEVVYTGVVPQNLADNTIYVVSSGTQNISASRNMANCSAIIGLGDVILRKNSNMHAISSNSKTNWIIDNIDVDGNGQGSHGIYVYNTSPNNTINNMNIYRNNNYGMWIAGSSHYNMINNSNFYNNTIYGLYLNTQRNVVNNVQIYNNNNHGLVVNSTYNTINNIQSYNNNSHGIYAGSTNNVYNNIQTYNNSVDGIRFMTNTNTNVINNFMAYNNAGIGINTQNYQVTYFGNNRAFDNGGANTGTNLVAGSSSPVGRTNGVLTGGILNWDFMTNPLNSSNTYLLNWSGDWSSLRGRFVLYYNAAVPTQKYSYGSGIWTQIQPVYYDNTTLKTGGLFATNKYIGSDTPKVSGTLLGLPTTFGASNVNVSGNSVSDLVGKYSIFGDLMSYIIESNIGTTTGINLVLGLPQNRVVTQLLGGNNWINVGSPGFGTIGTNQSLAIDGNGTPYLAYLDHNLDQTVVMKYNGSSWVNVGGVFGDVGAWYQSLAIDRTGIPYVAYRGGIGSSYRTTVMKYDGNSWVNVGAPAFSDSDSTYQSLAIDGNGTPYVAYRDHYISSYRTTVKKYNGSSRVNVGSPRFSAGAAAFQSLAIDSSGTPYVAYSDNANGYKTTVMKYNGSSRVNVGSVGFSAGAAYEQSLAIDGNGTPYVAYRDSANSNKTTVMKYNGSSRVNVGSVGFSAGAAYEQSLAIDGSGTPYVAYRDSANSNKTTVMKYNGSSRVNVGSVGFSAGTASDQSLAIDGSGTPYVAYSDVANGYKTTVMSLNEEYFATHFQNDTEYNQCLSGWDNDNFLDDSFWSQNPSDANILCALYGSGGTDQTAYTQIWQGGAYADDCGVAHMNVVHVTNPNSVPFGGMSANTVYVFQSGTYYLPNPVDMKGCVAFVSSGETTISTYDNYSLNVDNSFNIIDNIDIDGNNIASYGIILRSKRDTLHNMDIYNNVELGIRVEDSSENLLKNINIFNNDHGIYGDPYAYIIDDVNVHNNLRDGILFEYPEYNIINNSKIYNNGGAGINIYGGKRNSINNTLIFNNNGEFGLLIQGPSLNLINNSMIFSNSSHGVRLIESDVLFARSYVYNNGHLNGGLGIIVDSSSNLEYFDDNYVFDNYYGPFDIDGNIYQGGYNTDFNWGNGHIYDDGVVFDQIGFGVSRDYLVNPVNNTNQYMLDWIHRYDLLVGNFVFNSNSPIKYSYGSGIITQSVPVLFYAGVGLGTGLASDRDKFIGSNVDKYAGALQMPAYVSGTTITVTGTADPNDVNKYNLYSTEHLTTNYIGNNINNPVNITLNNWDGGKKIVTQIENTNNAYFATHFERETILDTSAPVTTNNANSVWRKTDLLVTLNAVDGGIGVDYTLYCITTTPSGCTPNITGTSVNVTCAAGNTCPAQYVRYRSVDLFGNWENIKTSVVIRIDKQKPSFTFSSNSGPECVAGSLNIVSASDIGVGLHTTPYSFNGSTWGTTTSTIITAQQPGTQNRTAYVRDALLNIGNQSATYTFTDSMPTANNFTGHANVGSGAKTVNWKTLSDAKDGACGAGDMSFDSIVTQGARGVCSVNGNNITYTPNEGQVGNDSCVIRVKDNEGNMINITVGWGGIQFALNPIIFFTGVNPVQNFNLNQNKYISQIQVEQTENMGIFDYIFDGQVHNVYDSGLVLMYNFDKIASLGENDSTIKDISQNNYTGTNINNAIRTANSKFNGGYKFNGIDQYIDIPQAVINSYPFTVSAWVKPSVVVGTQGIFFKGRSGFNNIQYGINLNDATFQITARNPLEQTANGTITAQAGQRYHVVGVFASATSRTIYVNGIQGEVSTDSVALHTSAPQHRTVAKYPGTANNYFSGEIDEVRVYDHALSAQEIQFLYKSNLSKIDTDKWLFETLNTCLGGNDSYLYTGYVENIYNQFASTGRKLSTNIQGLFATGLSNFDFGVDQVSSSVQIKTGQYNDYIEVHDKIANTGWRLTVSASNQLLGQENSFNIASSNLFFMPNNLDLLSGSSLPNTLGLNPSLENRSNIHVTPIDYFIKDFDPNDFMCDEGVFGDKPHLKLNIPAHQAPDTYVGTLYINIAP